MPKKTETPPCLNPRTARVLGVNYAAVAVLGVRLETDGLRAQSGHPNIDGSGNVGSRFSVGADISAVRLADCDVNSRCRASCTYANFAELKAICFSLVDTG